MSTEGGLPLVSVVMPAYNIADYIGQSIESVLASDYANIELIVVDDGSKDNTLAVAKEYEQADKRVKVLTKVNGGQGVARNFGVEASSGKYILFVDSDDLIGSSYISKSVAELEADEAVKVVTCRGEFFDGRTGAWKLKLYSPKTLAKRNVFTLSSMMRRDDFVRVGGFDSTMHNYCEDWALWINILKDGGKVVTLPTVEFYYRVRQGSSRFTGRKYWHELIKTLNRKFPDFFERELGGRLHSQRSMSKWLNRLSRILSPRKAVLADGNERYKYFMLALPRILNCSTDEGVSFGSTKVEVKPVANAKKEFRKAVERGDSDVVGYYTERRYRLFKRSWLVKLKQK